MEITHNSFEPDIPPPPPADYFLAIDQPDFSPLAETPLWRYIDLAKLVSLLDKQALYFARLDRLGDPFEGSITRYRQLRRMQIQGLYRDSQPLVESIIVNTIVNCWHANEGESFAMWSLYAPHNQGVALRSTYGAGWRPAFRLTRVIHLPYPKDPGPGNCSCGLAWSSILILTPTLSLTIRSTS